MPICNALIKHGHENFRLEILEYCECEVEKLLEREKYYIKLLPHTERYNIIEDPTLPPMSGRKHSDESKQIISEASKARTHSDETKKIISEAMVGKPRPQGSGKPSQQIEVLDIKNNTTISYDSIHEAARALKINESSIRSNLKSKSKKPYKNLYMFTSKK